VFLLVNAALLNMACGSLACLSFNKEDSILMILSAERIHAISLSLSLSLHFNGHFLGEPGLAVTRMSPFWILL